MIKYQGLEMPPADKGGPLTKDEIAILTKWVESGAQDPAFPLNKSEACQRHRRDMVV